MISLDPLKPYATMIKWGLGVVLALTLFGSGLFTGCSYKEGRMEKQINTISANRDYYKGQAEVNANALTDVNRQALANQQAAREEAERAADATKAADKAKQELAKAEDAWETKYAKLKLTPNCKDVLERKLCPALKDY